jgi:predicted nucleic acid-binding protein
MLLLDTSVWIDVLRGNVTEAARFALQQEHVQPLALTACIYQEVMQGARTTAIADQLHQDLARQELLHPKGLETYRLAADLYRTARRAGLTIRSSIDCLIAAQALENGCLLLHSDRDYLALKTIAPELLLYPTVLN